MMTSLSREDGCSNKGASHFQAWGRTTANPPGRWEIFSLIWGPERFGQYRSRRDLSLPGRSDHADIAIFAYLAFRTTVVIAAAVLELSDRVDVVAADANNPEDLLRGKIRSARFPMLILDDGRAVYDSSVIVEYLDALASGGRIIPDGDGRFAALTRQSLAEQMSRTSGGHGRTGARRRRKRAAWRRCARHRSDRLACALCYHDLRFAGAWRADPPRSGRPAGRFRGRRSRVRILFEG